MRIGVITTSFPHSSHPTSGSFVLELCLALAARGHRVEVIAPEPSDHVSGVGDEDRSIEVSWVPYLRPRKLQKLCHDAGIPDNVARRPWIAAQAAPLLCSLAWAVARQSRGWDGVITHWLLPSAVLALLVARGVPQVAMVHSADLWLAERLPLRRSLVRGLASSARAIAVVSHEQEQRLARIGGAEVARKTRLVRLGPDRHRAAQAGAAHKLRQKNAPEAQLVVAVLARLVPVKGVSVLIEALAQPGTQGIVALVAGEGPERHALAQKIEALGAPVHLLGHLGPADKAALLEAADLFVLPSIRLPNGRSEGTPVAVAEAMAAGLPVVASEVGGIGEAVGAAGILVTPGDPAELARALVRMRDEPAARIFCSQRATEMAAAFGWHRAAEQMEMWLQRNSSP